MKIVADTHTHTIASDHAYSTILENAKFASEIGLKVLAMTDHAPLAGDSPHLWYFHNIYTIPDELFGVQILHGVEADIIDFDGTLDLDHHELKRLEWVIASIHSSCMPKGTVDDLTRAYLAVAKNEDVDVIGHSGLEQYQYDYETCIRAFKEYGKLVEINQNTFEVRKASVPNCVSIAKLCKKYEVPVVVNSDSHFAYRIGQVDDAMALLREIDFPEELIVNADMERFAAYLQKKRGRNLLK